MLKHSPIHNRLGIPRFKSAGSRFSTFFKSWVELNYTIRAEKSSYVRNAKVLLIASMSYWIELRCDDQSEDCICNMREQCIGILRNQTSSCGVSGKRSGKKPSHGGRVTAASAPKHRFPRAAERYTAPAIRTD
jgi:hypothetical protein